MDIVYLDWAASAIPDLKIIDAVSEINRFFFGNPSSQHHMGKQARDVVESARADMAEAVGCSTGNIFFTSGGTESNNMVLKSVLTKKRKNGILCSAIEHASIFETAQFCKQQGFPVAFAGSDAEGFTDPEKVYDAIDSSTGMVAVLFVNNESGAIQPLADICRAVRERETEFGSPIHIHTDAVQALGKLPFDAASLDIDSASFSAHKLGGAKGAGALYTRRQLSPLIIGGGQEDGVRSGTENTGAIHGFSLAVKRRAWELKTGLEKAELLRKKLSDSIDSNCGGRVLGMGDSRYSPYITTAFFPPVPGEVLARVLNDRGFAVSTGSACSVRKKKKTRILENMGISPVEAASALRISIGHSTTEDEITAFCKCLAEEVNHLRKVTG